MSIMNIESQSLIYGMWVQAYSQFSIWFSNQHQVVAPVRDFIDVQLSNNFKLKHSVYLLL